MNKPLAAFTAFFTGVAIGNVVWPAEAKADPVSNYVEQNAGVICDTLYTRPLLSTVDAVVAAVMTDTGWDAFNSGRVVGQAVYQFCPENAAVVDRYIAVYSDARYLA